MSTTETNLMANTTATPLLSSTNTDIHRSLGRDCVADSARPASCRPEPVSMVIELIWSTIIVSVAIVVLTVLSKDETTEIPLRTWIAGFVFLRVFRMICVCLDYLHRRQVWEATTLNPENTRKTALGRAAKSLHTIYIVLSVIWWIVGLYWIVSGGKSLANDAPKLFWLTVILLALDWLVVLAFAFVSCIMCIAGCCCIHFITSIQPYVPNQNGANEDLMTRFRRTFTSRLSAIQESPGGSMNDSDTDSLTKHAIIPAENAV